MRWRWSRNSPMSRRAGSSCTRGITRRWRRGWRAGESASVTTALSKLDTDELAFSDGGGRRRTSSKKVAPRTTSFSRTILVLVGVGWNDTYGGVTRLMNTIRARSPALAPSQKARNAFGRWQKNSINEKKKTKKARGFLELSGKDSHKGAAKAASVGGSPSATAGRRARAAIPVGTQGTSDATPREC